MLGMLGKKIGMTQIFDKDGRQIPATVLQVGPCYVTDIRTVERDGYSAVQLGYEEIKEKKIVKAKKGHLAKSKSPAVRYVREIRTDNLEGVAAGQKMGVENFEVGDFVDIQGVSKGRGFQGVVKRHHFSGGEAAHGSKFGREIGSVGQSAFPSRVIKGTGMAGQMGNKVVTVQNIEVLQVDAENNLLVTKGNVPGANGQCLTIKIALKRDANRSWKVPALAEEKSDEKVKVTKEEAQAAEVESAEKTPTDKEPLKKDGSGSEDKS